MTRGWPRASGIVRGIGKGEKTGGAPLAGREMPAPQFGLNPWLPGCRSKELAPTRPLRGLADQAPRVPVRDAPGRARALDDRCAHRNAPLSAGRVREGRLQCGYHGWTYGADGALLEVPALAGEA